MLGNGFIITDVGDKNKISKDDNNDMSKIITDIKDKFATLRIYGHFGEEIEKIIEQAEDECYKTCERCGGKEKVRSVGKGWIYNLCKTCRKPK